ncbi:O-antigen ligase family protein [Nostoc sp. WHI]|uniref:O-antigen ligase family protein n=1 Tax=Nostoc sp. WHI TaxID=2650611 RepID=UPI0018C526C5|nr:O-antigen ligase family protein [Nostoc sp. WHI]MBG1271576.1 O-antigen ligase family protein [Nostoc sp. WHI]
MSADYISKVFELIFSPYGLIGIIIAIVVLNKATHSPRVAWLLFSVCCYIASLGKFQDEWIQEPPPLVFPLQQLRDMGRPLTIVLLGLLLILALQTKNGWRRILVPEPIKYLIAVQTVILFKILIYGNSEFALQAAFSFGAVVLTMKLGPSKWLQNENNFHLGVWSIAIVGVIFTVACSYQGAINMYAMTFNQGRFLGTTGNPIHASILLSIIIPCLIFLIESRRRWDLIKLFWIAFLFVHAYFLFLTGSRTGMIMGITSILLFYRNRVGMLLRFGLLIGLILVIVLSFINQDSGTTNYALLSDRFVSGGNTREGAWQGMWNGFMSNPCFGKPLSGERLVFGESSWLATADTTGVVGLIPLIMMGLGCLKMMFHLHKLSFRKPHHFLHTSTIISGLSSLLIGSFGEPFLLGNLSFPVMSLMIYLSLGQYLLDVDKIEKKYLLRQQN